MLAVKEVSSAGTHDEQSGVVGKALRWIELDVKARHTAILAFFLCMFPLSGATVEGVVLDGSGLAVSGAKVAVSNTQNQLVVLLSTDASGRFSVSGLGVGTYGVLIGAAGFERSEAVLVIDDLKHQSLSITLEPARLSTRISVTASLEAVSDVTSTSAVVAVRDEDDLRRWHHATIGNALQSLPGIHIQESTYGQVSPYLRGMTGYHVLNLVDGIRFNNSTFRSGPNQYLGYVGKSQVRRLETVLGPASAQYGSDSLGGTINVLTPVSGIRQGRGERIAFHSNLVLAGSSADASLSVNPEVSFGSPNVWVLLGGEYRHLNDLRPGRGIDSRHTLKRFFDLPDQQIRTLIGSRLQDSGFSQTGFHTKLGIRPTEEQNLTIWYQSSELDNVRNYRALWGGNGQLQGRFDPQALRFGYARYEKRNLGFLDSVNGAISINAQQDGYVSQAWYLGDTITSDFVRVNTVGYSGQARTHAGSSTILVFGGESYSDRIKASRFRMTSGGGTSMAVRALYPSGSKYSTQSLYGEATSRMFGGRLQATGGARYTRAGATIPAAMAEIGEKRSFNNVTFSSSISYKATSHIRIHARVGRGFRVPNMNDLGAIGVQDLGFEIPAIDAQAAGALVGSSAGESATSLGREVDRLSAETLLSYELGVTASGNRWYGRIQAFDAELQHPIVRRTLLFPADRTPSVLAGIPVTPIPPVDLQASQQVVTVATEMDPRAVKAFVNDGSTHFYGIEALLQYRMASTWMVETNYTFTVGRDLNPNRHLRRLAPQHGLIRIRHSPQTARMWWELAGRFVGPQERLSAGDLSDERIGASRSRLDIARVFESTRLSEFVDSRVLVPTNETLLQVQDRVLPLGEKLNNVLIADDRTQVPMFTKTHGWARADFSIGMPITKWSDLSISIENLVDINYRYHGSGIDGAGVNGYVSLRFWF